MFRCEWCYGWLTDITPETAQVGVTYELDLDRFPVGLYYDEENECMEIHEFCCEFHRDMYELVYEPTPYRFD